MIPLLFSCRACDETFTAEADQVDVFIAACSAHNTSHGFPPTRELEDRMRTWLYARIAAFELMRDLDA